jgi:hypothetical protein
MRRLSLILSDLYLPTESGPEERTRGGTGAVFDLPNLDWLLRFASAGDAIGDWRSWLSLSLGAAGLAQLPVARVCALGLLPDAVAARSWLATPVHLEARLDHVRLADRGLLRLRPDEREAWMLEFARSFGPEYALHDAGERTFLLSGAAATPVASVDPARLLDADIGYALPSVPAAGELRRLGTEIEMWLHGAAINMARERAGQRRVSALWLWGGGVSDPNAPIAASPVEGVRLLGGDAFLMALARTLPLPVLPAPASFAALPQDATRSIVELAPMTSLPTESLTALDDAWFSSVRGALTHGALESVDIIANDRWFRIAARPAWRIWRRHSPWLAQLGRKA